MEFELAPAKSFYQIGQRQNQEDARYPDTDNPWPECTTFVVCDGVGGLDKGEVASATVASAIGKAMEPFDGKETFGADDFARVLGIAYRDLARRNSGESAGMATTLTFLHFHRGGVFTAHIGDSRIYQFRPRQGIVFRSYDHSLVNALVRTGNLTPEEAVDHPQGNIISRCMGGADNENPAAATTVNITDVLPGDVFLLCSDGVLHCATDSELADLFDSELSDAERMKRLAAASESSMDNNTAIAVRVLDISRRSENLPEPPAPDDDFEAEHESDLSATRIITVAEDIAEEVKPEEPSTGKGFFSRLFGR